MEPEEIAATGTMASFDPRRTIEPFPNCFSIWPRVSPKVRARSFSSINNPWEKRSGGDYNYCTRCGSAPPGLFSSQSARVALPCGRGLVIAWGGWRLFGRGTDGFLGAFP